MQYARRWQFASASLVSLHTSRKSQAADQLSYDQAETCRAVVPL